MPGTELGLEKTAENKDVTATPFWNVLKLGETDSHQPRFSSLVLLTRGTRSLLRWRGRWGGVVSWALWDDELYQPRLSEDLTLS